MFHWIRCGLLSTIFLWFVVSSSSASDAKVPHALLKIVERPEKTYAIELEARDKAILKSPIEGLWSVAHDWRESQPAEWYHGSPTRKEQDGPWTILTGKISTPKGDWEVRDAYRSLGSVVKCVRRWVWRGEKPIEKGTLSVRFLAELEDAALFMPGLIYHGNPSGKRMGKNRVPYFDNRPGEETYFEEHRFPIPFESVEGKTHGPDPILAGAALHTVPSLVPFANRADQWWSLGVKGCGDRIELALLSGPCVINGQYATIKTGQRRMTKYDDTFMKIPPGGMVEKTFFLEAYEVPAKGAGFQCPMATAIHELYPVDTTGLPTFEKILEAKCRYLKTRWREKNDSCGFSKFPNRDLYVLGWCGQAASPGYALQVLHEKGLVDDAAARRAYRSLDFITDHLQFYETGFYTWYDVEQKQWRKRKELLSQGQAMLNLVRAVRAGRRAKHDTARWEKTLKKMCDLHASRILKGSWKPASTNEAFFVAPLAEASVCFDNETYRRAALKAGEYYAERHLDMTEPYWGGTLDARCEDKEGAYAAFQAFLALYEMTKEKTWLKQARHAGDVTLSYTYLWKVDFPTSRLQSHRFDTTGWTAVSAQNQHVDVYGVLIAPDVYRLGRHLHDESLKSLALVMYRSCGQMIDPFGSQGEQIQQTNFTQARLGDPHRPVTMRGNYHETWTVLWITAHFLHGAAQLAEQGVDLHGDQK
ncbi:MAG: hypothetical protein PVH19_03350 [Planctomycetia bacterium]